MTKAAMIRNLFLFVPRLAASSMTASVQQPPMTQAAISKRTWYLPSSVVAALSMASPTPSALHVAALLPAQRGQASQAWAPHCAPRLLPLASPAFAHSLWMPSAGFSVPTARHATLGRALRCADPMWGAP
eukprot:CAMPEP_0171156698 /NCGR_PEP_ID=MMETSP0790-20130122/1578_1 /TAXON_ID=2925 /ORGANISM="Alexandrium catenella, Strain OF101" /LENGTH=129 /DNA_ID=CAMNT_0011621013 /DNA_START=228 /DNA_END=614 /DNA_ORIENTATION=-